MKFRVYPYKQGSAGAKALAVALDGKVLKLEGSKWKPKAGDVVINWGSGKVPQFGPAKVLNPNTNDASCKLASFKRMKENDVRVPDFTEARDEAEAMRFPVVCRTKLRGHSGDGIVIANNKEELVNAPLYTQYVKKKDEYRVHVLGQQAFFIQRKARKLDNENPNWQIRNLAGGFVFVEVEEKDVPRDVIDQALAAVRALGLDFGGVDIMWNENEGKAYVLEINTACGLEERTADRYKQAFVDHLAD